MFNIRQFNIVTWGVRVIGRTSATEVLTGIKGGGGLEKYLGVSSLKPFINVDLVLERMMSFSLPEVEGLGKAVKGLPSYLFIEVCFHACRLSQPVKHRNSPKFQTDPLPYYFTP